jgi:uncharacterized protein
MSIYRLMIVTGLCCLFLGCSTARYKSDNPNWKEAKTNMNSGMHYLLGYGVKKNETKAFYYFNEAATKEDDPFAQNELAYLYATGKGVKRDDERAFFWYKKAAERGLASAEYNLGLFYLNGIGIEPDKQQAMIWFAKSAAHGFEPAIEAQKRYQAS